MALNDLLQNRFIRIMGTLAALAVPAGLGCEADEGTTNNYYGGGGSSSDQNQTSNPSGDNTGKTYTIADACQNLIVCNDPYKHTWMNDYNTCVNKLTTDPNDYWTQGNPNPCMLDCLSTTCVNITEDFCGSKCYGN